MAQEKLKFLFGIWLLLFSRASGSNNSNNITIQDAYGDGRSPPQSPCTDCTICPYPCHSQPALPPPPPPSGYQNYGVPPPPSPPSTSYGNCPPPPPTGQCCPQYNIGPPPPPYNYYSGSSTLLPFIKLFSFEWTCVIFLFSIMLFVFKE